MSLNDIYGDLYYGIPENEALYHAVDPENGDIQLPIIKLSPEELKSLTTYQNNTTVYQAYQNFAERSQKQIVKNYIKNKNELHEQPIVINNTTAIDGYHRIAAAILSNQSLNAVDISEL